MWSLIKARVHKLHKFADQQLQVFIEKNNDYGDSVHYSLRKYGIIAYRVRATDKVMRLRTLANKNATQKVQDERIEDTLRDLFTYTVMCMAHNRFNEINEERFRTVAFQLVESIEIFYIFLIENDVVEAEDLSRIRKLFDKIVDEVQVDGSVAERQD